MSGLFGGGGGQSQDQVAPVLAGIRLPSSTMGNPYTMLYGKGRVSFNLGWYGSFTAIPITTSTSSGGGKGGSSGGGSSQTTWTYTAALLGLLSQGPISKIGFAWNGRAKNSMGGLGLTLATGSYVQNPWGYLTTNFPGQDLAYRGISYVYGSAIDLGTSGSTPNLTFEAYADKQFGFIGTQATVSFTNAGTVTPVVVNHTAHGYPSNKIVRFSVSGGALPGGGAPDQALGLDSTRDYYVAVIDANHYYVSMWPSSAAIAAGYIYATDNGSGTLHVQPYMPDALPSECINGYLTNQYFGVGFPSAQMGSLTALANYCTASGTFISPVWDKQELAASALQRMLDIAYTGLVFSEGIAKFIPYYDAAITGNGVTFTPNLTVQYAFSDDHLQPAGKDADPVAVSYMDPSDINTQWQLQYNDRVYDYNSIPAQIIDQGASDVYGLRPASPVTYSEITRADVAQWVVGLAMQIQQNKLRTYKTKLPQWALLLEPMDFVSITEVTNGLSGLVVRMTEMEEDENGMLTCSFEDAPAGASSTEVYPSQAHGGYGANYNASAGNVAAPEFFTPDPTNSSTGVGVGIAVTGTTALYGGCEIWVSADGTSYSLLGVQDGGGATYGTITSNVTAAAGQTLGVSLAGIGATINGATSGDAQNGATLSLVDSEFFDYTTAALTGANAYNLTMAYRGVVNTRSSAPAAHSIGAPFIRINSAIVYGKDLPVVSANKPLFFKFLSFNIYGEGKQTLASVSPYSYTIGPFPDASFANYLGVQDSHGIISAISTVVTGLNWGGGGSQNMTNPCFCPRTGYVYLLGQLGGSGNTTVVVVDPQTMKVVATAGLGLGALTNLCNGAPTLLYASTDSQLYFTNNTTLYSLDPTTLTITGSHALPSARQYFPLAFAANYGNVYLVDVNSNHMCAWFIPGQIFSGEVTPFGAGPLATGYPGVYVPSADRIAFSVQQGAGTSLLCMEKADLSGSSNYTFPSGAPTSVEYCPVDDRVYVGETFIGGGGLFGYRVITPAAALDTTINSASAKAPLGTTFVPEVGSIFSVEQPSAGNSAFYTYNPRTRLAMNVAALISYGFTTQFATLIRCPNARKLVTVAIGGTGNPISLAGLSY